MVAAADISSDARQMQQAFAAACNHVEAFLNLIERYMADPASADGKNGTAARLTAAHNSLPASLLAGPHCWLHLWQLDKLSDMTAWQWYMHATIIN